MSVHRRLFLKLSRVPRRPPSTASNSHLCPVTFLSNAVHLPVTNESRVTLPSWRNYSSSNSAAAVSPAKKKKKKAASGTAAVTPTPDVERVNKDISKMESELNSRAPKDISVGDGGHSRYTLRSHTCGELTAEDGGKSVRLCGWLTFRRLNGRFLVLRDLYGVTQVYVGNEEDVKKAGEAPLESVLEVVGKVQLRPEGQRKSDQVSGDVEVVAEKITVLNPATELRLAYNDLDKVDDDLLMRYRYLQLRNANSQSLLRIRALFVSAVRRFMEANGFIDIETPTLIRRTPGGAREFPVPTKFKSLYYSLCQSPQILKQLLMCAGMDRYYQLARCYRDEPGKPDRQPEFTQLDIELSFTSREGVMSLIEDLLRSSLPSSLCEVPSGPFPVITYAEAMSKYGSDKPDTGGFLWVVDFPLFVRNPNSGKLESAHHPFTMPQDVGLLKTDPEKVLGLSYDLVYCGAEVGGGSVRIHEKGLQKYVFEEVLGLEVDEIGYLLEALESGCPPHGGFALGVDRFLSKVFGTSSIRDVIAFPKSSDGKDLLSGAPTELGPEPKKYYGL